jgi:hypothetical protein
MGRIRAAAGADGLDGHVYAELHAPISAQNARILEQTRTTVESGHQVENQESRTPGQTPLVGAEVSRAR